MSISYPNTKINTTAATRTPDLPLVIPMAHGITFPIKTYGTESQKIANILIPPSSSYNLSGSSYNIMILLEITGAIDATGSLTVQPVDQTIQFTNNIGMSSFAEIKYYGDIPPFFNDYSEPGFPLELYMSGSDTNLTCSLHKFEMIFNHLE
jgi:hypothetical protein